MIRELVLWECAVLFLTIGCYEVAGKTDNAVETDSDAAESGEREDTDTPLDIFTDSDSEKDLGVQLCIRAGDVDDDGSVDEHCVYFGPDMGELNQILLRQVTPLQHSFDWMACFYHGDGGTESTGNLVVQHEEESKTVSVEWDGSDQDEAAESFLISYDDKGKVRRFQSTKHTTPVIQYTNTYEYEKNGKLSMREYDANSNGTIDLIDHFTYDSAARTVTEEIDNEGDGEIEDQYTFLYNSQGLLQEENKNLSSEGVAEVRVVHEYTFGENGLISTHESVTMTGKLIHVFDENYNYSKEIEYKEQSRSTFKYQYDEAGRVILYEYKAITKSSSKGQTNRYTYDNQGRVASREKDCNCDGKGDSLIVYSYDCTLIPPR